MKRRRFRAVNVGRFVFGGLLLAGGGLWITPAGAQSAASQTPLQAQLRQMSEKLDQVLAATKAGESAKSVVAEDSSTQRWDQVLPASQRFVVLSAFSNDAVLDKETGLVWEKSPQTNGVSAANSRLACANKAVGGRKGWRVPALPELTSLVDPSVASPGPTLPQGHPFLNVQAANYWSSSAHLENTTLTWGVGLKDGMALGLSKSFDQRIWCVRAGVIAD